MKRCLSIALAFALLLGLFGGIRPKAEAASYLKRLDKEVKMRIPIEKPWIIACP